MNNEVKEVPLYKSDFLGDIKKMIDFASLENDDFLFIYNDVSEEEYKATEKALSERGMTAEEYLQTIDEYRNFDLKNTFEKLGINDNVEHNTQGNELSIELGNGIELVASEKNTDGVFMYHDLKVDGELVICDGEYNRCIKGTDGNWHVFSNDDDNVKVFDIPDDVFNKLDSSLTYGYKKEIIDSCYDQYKSYLNIYGTKDDVVSREIFEKDIFPNKNYMTEYLQGNPVLLETYRNKSERILYEEYESSEPVQTVTENAPQISVNDSPAPVSVTPDMSEEKACIHRMFDDFFTSAFKGATENDPRCLNDIVKHIIIPAGNKNDLNTGTATFWRKACDHAANSGGWLFAGGNYELMQRFAKYKLLDEKILALDSDDPRFEKVHDKAYDKWGSYLKEYLMDTVAINDSLSRRLVNNGVDPVKVAGEKFMKQMEEVLPKYKNNPIAAMDFIFKDMDHAKFSLIKQYIKEQSNGNATKYFTEKFDLSVPEKQRNKSSDRSSSGIGR